MPTTIARTSVLWICYVSWPDVSPIRLRRKFNILHFDTAKNKLLYGSQQRIGKGKRGKAQQDQSIGLLLPGYWG